MNINNKILRYVEGQLKGQDRIDFENLIASDSQLRQQVDILIDLVNHSESKNVPYKIRTEIYNMLNIKDESFMDIIIKKSSDILNVLSGKDYLLEIEPTFVTRSSNSSLLFTKKMDNHQVYCDIYFKNNNYFLNLSVLNDQNKDLDNIRFIFNQNESIILEKYTSENGGTGSFQINQGIYDIKIDRNNQNIGNLKINIS
tara:strand:+ start:689 stop:1285 length:597 start_codon:yes stop_codon:yes gene_type:complete